MDPTTFDELTKALATSTSRRQALRRIGGTLTGVVLASLFPGRILASNSSCAKFCNAVFGADTPAAMQCISDAAHHKGLCYTCGPASPGGTKPICCPENGSGQCTSYSSATCCTSGQGCCSGTCTDLNTTSNCGSCGNTCSGTTPACCSGTCADLSSDPNNCGTCGNVCSSGTCQSGQCGCLGLNANCTSASQCCPSSQGAVLCSVRDTSGGGVCGPLSQDVCCIAGGGFCSSDCDCCGVERCISSPAGSPKRCL